MVNNDFLMGYGAGKAAGGGGSTLITKTITENGTYAAFSDNADGYSSVTVDVAGGGGGGAKVLTKIAEAEITSPVSAVTFPLTLFDNVDFFYLNIVDVVMSASDYIYFKLDNNNIGYTGKFATHNHKEIITIAPSISLDGVNWPKKACLAPYTAATAYVGIQTAEKTNFVCAAYTSATMQSGKIEIWGYV